MDRLWKAPFVLGRIAVLSEPTRAVLCLHPSAIDVLRAQTVVYRTMRVQAIIGRQVREAAVTWNAGEPREPSAGRRVSEGIEVSLGGRRHDSSWRNLKPVPSVADRGSGPCICGLLGPEELRRIDSRD